jgi:uncharacterized membrane protein YccC
LGDRIKRLYIYIAKIVAGILLSFAALQISDILDFAWILISVFLVLSPEGDDALELAIVRIKANLIGAATGLALIYFELPELLGICLGSIIALLICDLLKLSAGSRSTLAAVVIVMLMHQGSTIWSTPLHRVSSVVVGCTIGLLITYVFHSLLKVKTPAETLEGTEKKKERES